MATQFDALTETLTSFIRDQHIFFCATAGPAGRVNVSPKGMDSLRVMGPNRIVWRNLTGSGNETAGLLAQINRMTLMWCGFEAKPMILRVYGSAGGFRGRGERELDQFGHLIALHDADDQFTHRVRLLPAGYVFGIDLEFWPTFVHIGDDHLGARQAEIAILCDVAEHEIEHPRHQ